MAYPKSTVSEKIIWYLTVSLFSLFYIFDTNVWIGVILIAITAAVFCVSAVQTKGKIRIKIQAYHGLVLLFALYCMASALWAWDFQLSINRGITIVELLICTSVFYIYYENKNSICPLINVIMWSGYLVTVYAFLFYGVQLISSIISSSSRLDNSFANVNSIGMLAAFSIILSTFNLIYMKKRLTVDFILNFPCIIMIAATGSRKALVLMIMGIGLLVFVKFYNRNLIKTMIQWLFVGIVLVFILYLLYSLSIFDGVKERMAGLIALVTGKGEVDHSAWIRQQYIYIGLEQFKKTPIFGIGIANSGLLLLQQFERNTYLHNNYVELLATGGLVGTLLYYSMYLYCIVMIIKYRKLHNPYSIICLILIFCQLVMDYGAVSYYSKSTYFYLMTYCIHIQNLKTNRRNMLYENSQDC